MLGRDFSKAVVKNSEINGSSRPNSDSPPVVNAHKILVPKTWETSPFLVNRYTVPRITIGDNR
jgi:hypothetical protein